MQRRKTQGLRGRWRAAVLAHLPLGQLLMALQQAAGSTHHAALRTTLFMHLCLGSLMTVYFYQALTRCTLGSWGWQTPAAISDADS